MASPIVSYTLGALTSFCSLWTERQHPCCPLDHWWARLQGFPWWRLVGNWWISKASWPALGNPGVPPLPVSGSYRAGCRVVLAGQLLELVVAVTCLLAHILVSVLSLWELTVTLFLVLRDTSLLQPLALTSGQGPWDELRLVAQLKVGPSMPSQPTYHRVVVPGPL